ncbi:dentin sialophosphoprotein [Octopus sinensis]|uniref:Dentin sialophosphoprotein n=1 Tax=Octopus sinensis TaxID=2607531 RepID=A0A6P7SFJ9_9MOLL|nr:dentin sialophosphoprotein [Octopus sinensis]
MASLGQTVAGFLLLKFCLCCFYQPCLSNPNLLNNNCLSFPPNCLDGGTSLIALQPICLYLKNSQNLCLPQYIQTTISDVLVCDKLSELAPQLIKPNSCPVFCQTFKDICQYLYSTEKIKLIGKTDSDFSQNETTINSDNNVSYEESERNNIKPVEVSSMLSKDKNIDNKITTTGFHSISSSKDIGKIPDTVSSGNQPNSSNSLKGSVSSDNVGKTHVDDAKTNNQSVFQNPPNIGSQPNFRFQSSGSLNLSNTRNGPNIEIPHVSINSSKTGSGAANTRDRTNSSISLKGTVSSDNVGKTHVEDAKTDTQSSVFQNPLNTGSQPNSSNSLKGSVSSDNVGKTHVEDAKTDTQSPVFQNPLIIGSQPNSSNSLKGSVSSDNVGKTHVEDAKTDTQSPVFQNPLIIGSQPNSSNSLKGSVSSDNVGKTHVEDAKTDTQSPVFQNPLIIGSQPNSSNSLKGSVSSDNVGKTHVEDAKTDTQSPVFQNPLIIGSRPNSRNSLKGSVSSDNVGKTHVDDAKTNNQYVFQNPPNIGSQPNFGFQSPGSLNLSNTRNGPNIEIPHVSINSSKTGSGAANTRDRTNSSISLKGTVSSDNVGKTHVEDAKTDTQSSVFQNPLNTGSQPNSNISLKGSTSSDNVGKTHVDDAKTDNQSVFQNPPNTGIDASKTSDTRANISLSEDQAIQNRFDSQQSAKLSIGNKPDIVPKKTPVSTAYNEAPSSAHFMGYFLTAIVLCIAGYIVFHNKQKIIAFIIEGRNQKRGRRPNANEYKKLQTNVDDVMVSLDKSTTAQNYIY